MSFLFPPKPIDYNLHWQQPEHQYFRYPTYRQRKDWQSKCTKSQGTIFQNLSQLLSWRTFVPLSLICTEIPQVKISHFNIQNAFFICKLANLRSDSQPFGFIIAVFLNPDHIGELFYPRKKKQKKVAYMRNFFFVVNRSKKFALPS